MWMQAGRMDKVCFGVFAFLLFLCVVVLLSFLAFALKIDAHHQHQGPPLPTLAQALKGRGGKGLAAVVVGLWGCGGGGSEA